MSNTCLIIFTRYPEPGKVKTRLIPALGAGGAALLHQQMTEHTIKQARALQQLISVTIEVWFTGGNQVLMQDWLGEDLTFQEQPLGDLGDRMSLAVQKACDQGYTAVVIIGTDCLDLSVTLLEQSFQMLKSNILTIGPATDGGYYLIGLQRSFPALFTGINWSTDTVLRETLKIAEDLQLKPTLLPCLHDTDIPEDLLHPAMQNFRPDLGRDQGEINLSAIHGSD
jgi:uncharacterized protein